MSKRNWTAEELDEVRRRYHGGEDDQEIAVILGRSKGSISNARQAHGILRPQKTLKRARVWTEDEIEYARSTYAMGFPNRFIAERLGRTRISIKRLVTDRGFRRDPFSCIDPAMFDTQNERWLATFIPGYAVSSVGRVMSLMPGRVGMVLKPWTDQDGYKHVTLRVLGRDVRFAIHRLVVRAFHGPQPTPTHQAAHDDGDPGNNLCNNLRWATAQENQGDRLRHGTAKRGIGGRFIKCGCGTADMVRQARAAGVQVIEVDGRRDG